MTKRTKKNNIYSLKKEKILNKISSPERIRVCALENYGKWFPRDHTKGEYMYIIDILDMRIKYRM